MRTNNGRGRRRSKKKKGKAEEKEGRSVAAETEQTLETADVNIPDGCLAEAAFSLT